MSFCGQPLLKISMTAYGERVNPAVSIPHNSAEHIINDHFSNILNDLKLYFGLISAVSHAYNFFFFFLMLQIFDL